MARAAVVRLPTISITSPSLRPSSSIRPSDRRAKPRPLSAGGRLATCTLRDVTRSIVSASGIFSPDPPAHTGYATAAQQAGFHCRSIFDCTGDFTNDRARREAAADRDGLVDESGNHDGLVLLQPVES